VSPTALVPEQMPPPTVPSRPAPAALAPAAKPPTAAGPGTQVRAGAPVPVQVYSSPLGIKPYMLPAQRPFVEPWTGSLRLTGVAIGAKRTAILQEDGASYVVEPGGVIRKLGKAPLVCEQIGDDYVKLRYGNRSYIVHLREGP